MRTFTFTLLATLTYVAMIGATPLQSRDDPTPCGANDELCDICTVAENYGDQICSGFCNYYTQLEVCKGCPSDDSDLGICKDFCIMNPSLCSSSSSSGDGS